MSNIDVSNKEQKMNDIGISNIDNTVGYHIPGVLITAEGVYFFHDEDVKKIEAKAADRRAKIDKILALDKRSLKAFDDFILGYKLPSQTIKAYKRGCKIFLQVVFYDLFLGV